MLLPIIIILVYGMASSDKSTIIKTITNCGHVAFQLDDIQDYLIAEPQMKVMNTLDEKMPV